MAYLNQMDCCGLCELAGIRGNDPKEILADCYQHWTRDNETAFVVFTDVVSRRKQYVIGDRSYALPLATYIKKQRLGTLTISERAFNKNSGNNIKVWVWQVNRSTFHRWAKKQEWYGRFINEMRTYYGWT